MTNNYTITPIAINFMDNDYGNTFMPIMKFLHGLDFVPNKTQLINIINEISFGFYLAYQDTYEYKRNEHLDISTRSYLQLDEKNIYLGDEVKDWIIKNNFNHSCWYIYHNSDDKSVYTA